MKRSAFFVLLLLVLSASLSAQTPNATPPVKDDGDVVKISTSLIQIDVTVTDRKGKIVTDLKPEDFEVYENKEKQNITNFSFVLTSPATTIRTERKTEIKDQTEIPLPPIPVKPEQIRRTIALVVDDLGLSAQSIHFVRRSLRKFVDEQMQPNDLIAIIRTGGNVGATQQFTNDKRLLYAAIEKVKWNSSGRADAAPFPTQDELLSTEEAKLAGLEVSDAQIEEERQRIGEIAAFKDNLFFSGTLGAVNFIIKGMSTLPGRKSIMFFSDGFRISPSDTPGRMPPMNARKLRDRDDTIKLLESLKKLTEVANRASIIIYSFDPRGLVQLPPPGDPMYNGVKNRLYNNQEGMTFLAKETGGKTFLHNNDMNIGLEEALEDQKGFYLIGYQPDTESFDPKTRRFNKLQVKVKRPGLTVRYRSGFFGVTDNERLSANESISPQNNSEQQLLTAISSPFSVGEIKLKLNTVFGNNQTDGSFIRSFVHINASELNFSDEPDGWKKAVFDVLAMSFGDNGAPVDTINKTYTLQVKDDKYQKILKEGFVYNFLFPVKKPGVYQMRVAIRDTTTSKIGSDGQIIEVPDLQNNRLTLSGIVLENFTAQQWQQIHSGTQADLMVDAMSDTAVRQFKKGTILRYNTEIYNVRSGTSGVPNIQTQMKLFRDGKEVLKGKFNSLNPEQPIPVTINFAGALVLGDEMEVGNYILQILVVEAHNKDKPRIATQWIQFEITE